MNKQAQTVTVNSNPNSNAPNTKGTQTMKTQPKKQANTTQTTSTSATTPAAPIIGSVNWPQYVAVTTTAFQTATAGLGVTGAPPGSTVKKTAKPRKGFEGIVPQVANLLTQYGLDTPALSAETMLGELANAQVLLPLLQLVQNYAKALEGVVFENQAGSWEITLQGYAALKRMAKANGALATALESGHRILRVPPRVGEGRKGAEARAQDGREAEEGGERGGRAWSAGDQGCAAGDGCDRGGGAERGLGAGCGCSGERRGGARCSGGECGERRGGRSCVGWGGESVAGVSWSAA